VLTHLAAPRVQVLFSVLSREAEFEICADDLAVGQLSFSRG